MAKKARAVRHLQERDGRFYARLAVPVELRPIIGKRELLEPLGPIRARAIANLHAAVARFQAVLDEARQGVAPDPQPVAVRRAARDHYAAELKLDDATAGPGRFNSRAFNARAADPYVANLQRVAAMPAQDEAWRDDDAKLRRRLMESQLARLRAHAVATGYIPNDLDLGLIEAERDRHSSFVEATVGHAITHFLGEAEHRFALTPASIVELEKAAGVGIGTLFKRIEAGHFYAADLGHVVRLALIGGGATPASAKRLCEGYVDTAPIAGTKALALTILEHLWLGAEAHAALAAELKAAANA